MKHIKLLLTVTVAASLLTGCATIFTGSTQSVKIKTVDNKNLEPIQGARCRVTDGSGESFAIDSTPGQVELSKGKGALQVACMKPGYGSTHQGVRQDFNFVSLINILFWPGFIVDAVTGSIQRYPSTVTVNMDRR